MSPADSTNHHLPYSPISLHLQGHHPQSGFHLLPPRPVEQLPVRPPPIYPLVCGQRELSKVRWVHVLFFSQKPSMSSHYLRPWGRIQGSSYTGPIPLLFSFITLILPLRILHFGLPRFSLFPKQFHSFASLVFCLCYFFCLEWHFIPYLSRKHLCFKRPIDGGCPGRMMPSKLREEWVSRRRLYWTLELAT